MSNGQPRTISDKLLGVEHECAGLTEDGCIERAVSRTQVPQLDIYFRRVILMGGGFFKSKAKDIFLSRSIIGCGLYRREGRGGGAVSLWKGYMDRHRGSVSQGQTAATPNSLTISAERYLPLSQVTCFHQAAIFVLTQGPGLRCRARASLFVSLF